VNLAEVTEFILDGEITDSNKDLRVDFVVVRVDFGHNFTSSLIQNWKHACRLLC
jgi:hypothetical protein